MRWITFVILLYFAAALDVARFGALRPYPAHHPLIEFIPLLAIFYALYADEAHAPLAGFWCALLYDVLSPEPLGLHTLSLALVCYGIVRIRLSIFRELWLSQFMIVFLGILGFGLLAGVLRVFLPWIFSRAPTETSFFDLFKITLANALYTAFLAPAIYWLLFQFPNLLGFRAKSHRGR